jgi:hypothetical protein
MSVHGASKKKGEEGEVEHPLHEISIPTLHAHFYHSELPIAHT